jgi:hypothetical protein
VRWLIAIAVALLGVSPASATAKPKVAVAPVDGDSDGQMGDVVRDALGGKLSVVAPKEVERAMSKLGLSGELEDGDAQKLRQKLDAAVVVQGKLSRAGKKKTVKLTVWVRGKKPSDFNVQYRTATSEKFRDAIRDALLKRIGSVDDLAAGGDEDGPKKKKIADGDEDGPKKKKGGDGDEDAPKKKKVADGDEDGPKKKKVADGDEDGPKKKKKGGDGDEDGPKKKKLADGDTDGDEDGPKKKKKKVAVAEDEDQPKVRKRKRSVEGDGEGVAAPAARTQPAVRVDAGASYAARYLSFSIGAGSANRPPKVLTPAAAGHVELELYPFAFSNKQGGLSGLGIYGEYDKSFGLAIAIPDAMGVSAPINQAHYSIGARYRFTTGKSTFAGGVAYARRHYIADRSKLGDKVLDAPDVDYAAISPGIVARRQLGQKLALFGELDAMLVLSAGAIATASNYGSGSVFGVGVTAGFDVALSKQLGLRLAGGYNHINLSFKGTGAMSTARKVTAATDRDIGATATLAAMF